MPQAPVISVATLAHEREAAYRLRYDVSVVELGKQSSAADHDRRTLVDELDGREETVVLQAVFDGATVGTIRFTSGSPHAIERFRHPFSLDLFEPFPPSALSFTARLAVAPDWRSSPMVGLLLQSAYREALQRGLLFNFCQCAPGLVHLYEQLGYRRYRDNFADPESGYHVPLVMVLDDIAHLKQVRSPLWRIARGMSGEATKESQAAAWFNATIAAGGEGAGLQEAVSPLAEERVVDVLTRAAHRAEIPLFRGLDHDQVDKLLEAAVVLHCRSGDRIISTHEVGNELFALLSGSVAVSRGGDGAPLGLTTLGPGEIFGELAFLSRRRRSADVTAETDLEVLVISQAFLQKIMRSMPDTALKLLFNLSLVLCERLERTTDSWMNKTSTSIP